MSAQLYFVPDKTEERRKAFLKWTSIDLSSKLFLTCGTKCKVKGRERPFLEGAKKGATL